MAKVPEGPWQKLGAAATVVGVVLAAYFGFSALGSSSSKVGPSAKPSSPRASSGSLTPTSTPAAAAPSYYQPPISVGISSGGNGLDFDLKPPGAGPGPVSFFYDTFALKKGGSSTVDFGFAVWNKGGTPTFSDCKTWVSTHLVGSVYTPTAGTKICFATDHGRIGLLVVQPGTSENQFNAIARVWGS